MGYTSEALVRFRDLYYRENWRVISVELDLNTMVATAVLFRDGQEIPISSNEPDFFMTVAKLRPLPDNAGKFKFSPVDLSKYDADIEYFIDEGNNKLKKAMQQVIAGEKNIELSVALATLKRLLTAKQGNVTDDSLMIKENYFEILSLITLYSKSLLVEFEKLEQRLPGAVDFRREIETALQSALFGTLDENPIETIRAFYSWVDLERIQKQISGQSSYVGYLLAMLAQRGTVPGEEGILYHLDFCRRFLELTRPFYMALLRSHWHKNATNPVNSQGYEWEIAELKKSGFNKVLLGIEPKLRNSESHLHTEILHSEKLVRFNTNSGAATYTYIQIVEMSDALQKTIIPGFLIAFQRVELFLFLMLLRSPKFKLILIRETLKRK